MSSQKITNLLKTIGPGILFAGAAIGGSHLVQSTRAGADFGFSLIFLVLAANFLKYPFFEYGQRYTAVTKQSLLEGYLQLGKPVLYAFFFLSILTGLVNSAAVTMVTAGIAGHVLGSGLNISMWSGILLIATLFVLLAGNYGWIDSAVKCIIITLTISTIAAVIIAFINGPVATSGVKAPFPYTLANLSFLVALLGWMPAPIEGSVWPSLWMLERTKQTGHTPTLEESLFDFKLGYIVTAILAAAFVCLGALVMFGSGESFSSSGISFAGQLVDLYIKSLGPWSAPLISIAALATMVSTTLTVLDAYPRSLAGSMSLLFKFLRTKIKPLYQTWVVIACIGSFVIIQFFAGSMRALIDFATILSFLAAPFFAWINFKVVTHRHMPKEQQPKMGLQILSWAGMLFLSLVSILYILKLIKLI